MRNRLFILGRFPHDPQSILATVYRLAFMGIKRGFNESFGVGLKLQIATLTYASYRRSFFHDSQLALRHTPSLAHLTIRAECLSKSNGTTTGGLGSWTPSILAMN